MELNYSINIDDVKGLLNAASRFSDEVVRLAINDNCLVVDVLDFHDRNKTVGQIKFFTEGKAELSISAYRYCFHGKGVLTGNLESSDFKTDFEGMTFEFGKVFLGYGEVLIKCYDTHKSLEKNTDTYLLSISTCRKIEIYK